MSAPSRKPLANSTNATSPVARRSINENTVPRTSPATSGVQTATGQGVARSPSVRATRPPRKLASRSETSFTAESGEEETRSSNAELIKELREQVQKAESASDQYQKQLEILQQRWDEISKEQTLVEEREHERISRIVELETQLKDINQQTRSIEQAHEAEKALMLQERERQIAREGELQSTIVRLNEAIRQKGKDRLSMSRSASLHNILREEEEDSMNSVTERNSNREQPEALLERDKMIENLRLELAETQIKVAELEHLGDGRLQELEKTLLETRMTNARLTEDNESFQLLLSQKTLKGDFLHDSRDADATEDTGGLSSLAEELESAGDPVEGQTDGYRKLEAENKSLRESNKALTLYIDKIIGRLLQHEGFEHIIHDKDGPPEVPSKDSSFEKALPPPPDQSVQGGAPVVTTLLQRAKSVVSRPAPPKARPQSYMPPTANENPDTAPSIPIGRGHRRARSDQASVDLGPSANMAAAAVVQQMNRGSPLRTVSGGAMSQGISPLSPHLNATRPSYFQTPSNSAIRTTSGGAPTGDRSSSASIASEHSDEKLSIGASSAQTGSQGANNIPGAVMKQNQLRPLRLVREQNAIISEEEAKKANRGSWMGWFRGTTLEAQDE